MTHRDMLIKNIEDFVNGTMSCRTFEKNFYYLCVGEEDTYNQFSDEEQDLLSDLGDVAFLYSPHKKEQLTGFHTTSQEVREKAREILKKLNASCA